MTHAVLLTQCLQHDFVGPLGPHEPPPCRLHVGAAESERLLGRDPAHGPLAQLFGWARAQSPEDLTILHVRDQHRASDPAQADHLAAFGPHCLVDSRGARLVLDLDEHRGPNESYVDALHLNDFVDTDLETRLRALVNEKGQGLRAAIIGVWTDAKVTFLAYELVTRLGLRSVATCSALTASASREKHFVALDQLASLLGVEVTHSPAELAAFLVPGTRFGASTVKPETSRSGARPAFTRPEPPFEPSDEDALAWLYRDSKSLELAPLSGGFSGARVFSVHSLDAHGHAQAPTVLKLGPRALVSQERVAVERVESVLGNDAPRLLASAEFGDRGALKYAFATMRRGGVSTLKKLYEKGEPLSRLEHVVDAVFSDVLARFADAAQYEACSLLPHYGFSAAHAASVAKNVAKIRGEARDDEPLVRFYRDEITALGAPRERHLVGYVHGDLNGANVLVDAQENVWLIDFAHASRRQILGDLVKLENDLLFLFQSLPDDAALDDARLLVDRLAAVEDLRDVPDVPAALRHPSVLRAASMVRVLRRHVARYAREDRSPHVFAVGALRYAAHTLSFEEADARQKRLALHAAEAHARAILAHYRMAERLRIDWVPAGARRLGLTICPGRRDWDRDLGADLDTIRAEAAVLVSLLSDEDLRQAGVPELPSAARARGLDVVRLPIVDQGVPSRADLASLFDRIDAGLRTSDVIVHCIGGLGRTGTIVASWLVSRGHATAEQAIAAVRAARGPRCIETAAQERFVRETLPA